MEMREILENSSNQPQSGEIILSVQGVSKKFCRNLKRSLYYGVKDIASELVGVRGAKNLLRQGEFWALKDISFELRTGEALGLVGKNGSGKTTLLRIIAGLIRPDTGFVEVRGRIAPLIALGAGFNPILTGRENVYANMSVLGVPTKEIKERFEQVVEFAEIGEAIDTPVQSYSSGMAARLGFASAVHTEPDILLIDEVLAVGDIKFREKCNRKLAELRRKGVSFILVSHDTQSMLIATETAVYLSAGNLVATGDTASIMRQYETELFLTVPDDIAKNSQAKQHPSVADLEDHREFKIKSIFFRDAQGNIGEPKTSETSYLCIEYQALSSFEQAGIIVEITKMGGLQGGTLFLSSENDQKTLFLPEGNHEIQIYMSCLGLITGHYQMRIAIRQASLNTLDDVPYFGFTVTSDKVISRTSYYQDHSWNVV